MDTKIDEHFAPSCCKPLKDLAGQEQKKKQKKKPTARQQKKEREMNKNHQTVFACLRSQNGDAVLPQGNVEPRCIQPTDLIEPIRIREKYSRRQT